MITRESLGRRKKYQLRLHFFPQNQIIKSLLVDDFTMFKQVKEDIVRELLNSEMIAPESQFYYSLMISFESYAYDFQRSFFPHDQDLVVPLLQAQEWNSLGKVRLNVVDLRYIWKMEYFSEVCYEPKIIKQLEAGNNSNTVNSSSGFDTAHETPLFQDLLHYEICGFASMQGKLKRRFETSKKKEDWRY
jgi:hypothetical protein